MQYKILGKTGLKVSVVGFGGIPVQRIDIDETKKVISKAEELGINFIDSARGYTISEEFIGNALADRRDKWIIATKSMARSKEAMEKDIDISLKNLKTSYIDLYQLHNIRTEEELKKVLKEDGAYDALLEAREQGKIRHIGITSHSVDLLKLAIETNKFESIMYPYNIVENQAEELFSRSAELNIGVIAMKPMAGGAIDDGRLALKYILRNQSVTTAIPGMASVKEVEENAEVSEDKSDISLSEKRKIDEIIKALGKNFCRRCGYCGPCPQQIDIPSMFLFKGYKDRYDLSKWAEDRYFAQKANARDCVECGLCEKKCPYDLPIRKMLKEVKATFE